MTGQSVALPRVRTRRKRRKPMPPWLKFYLGMVVAWLVLIGWCVIDISLGKEVAWNSLLVALDSMFLCHDWGDFKREWAAWRRDDE